MTEAIPDQAARDSAIDPRHSVLLRAPAGSGKTGVLLLRYLRCLLTVPEPEAVVAITFTRKAAAEIRERIVAALSSELEPTDAYQRQLATLTEAVRARAAEHNWQLLENPSRLRISTFDSFCSRIARRLPLLSGLGQIQTSDDADGLYREAILNLFRQLETADPELQAALGTVLDYANNRLEQLLPLLANLLAKRDQWVAGVVGGDLEQMEATLRVHVQAQYRALCSQLQAYELDDVVALVQAQSAESEMLAWAADCRPLDGEDVDQLAVHARLAALLLTGSGTLRKRVDRTMGFAPKQPGTEALKEWLAQWQDCPELEAALSRLAQLPLPHLPTQARALIEAMTRVLTYLLAELHLVFDRRGQLDFPEVAFRAIRALAPLTDSAGVYGDALLQEDRIQHLLVDEMQDTSVNQIVLLQYLMEGWQPGDGRSLFLCGDLQQSIYLFRGALVGEFQRLLDLGHFNGHPLQPLQLLANFRSAPQLVDWVNRAFTEVFEDDYVPAAAQRRESGAVAVHGFIGDRLAGREAEARRVVELVAAERAADPEASLAILVRSRSHLQAIVPALKAAGIAFAGQDIDKLAREPAVADFLALLKAWWHPADRASWIGLLRAPFVGFSWDDCWVLANAAGEGLISDWIRDDQDEILAGELVLSEAGRARLRRLREGWRGIATHPRAVDIRWAVPALWHSLGGPACVDEAAQRNIDRVLAVLAEQADGGYLRDIAEFDRALDRLFALPAPASLEIMTIHKAKGLEFDVVILPGLGSGTRSGDSNLFCWRRIDERLLIAPRSARGDEPDTDRFYAYLQGLQQDDQRREVDRLLYVALTRARRQLHLLGTVAADREGAPRVDSGSLLARLWPRVETDFAAAETLPEPDTERPLQVPLAPRLAPDWQLRIHRQWHGDEPSEAGIDRLARQERLAVLEANIEERAIGLVYHELMRRLASGFGDLVDRNDELSGAVRARLRHHCHPEAGLSESVERVLQLAGNTRACPHGQWILGHYASAGAEQALRRQLGERWQKLIIDRFFVDGDTCWIIDYKTAQGSGEAFLAAQKARYQDKMQLYKETIAEATAATKVRAALYFPACQALVEC